MENEKKYEHEIIKRLEFLCPNILNPEKQRDWERNNLTRVDFARGKYAESHRVLIEDEFREKKWEPIPESKEELIYLAALNSIIEQNKKT